MLSSPAKRRKTSPTTAVSVNASGTTQRTLDHDDRRVPSHRTSFQSPTKASLARSHPDILARALSRSPTKSPRRPTSRGSEGRERAQTEERVFGLRDRKALRPSLTASGSPTRGPRQSTGVPAPSPHKRLSGIQAFAAPPRRVSRRIAPSDLVPGAPTAPEDPVSVAQTATPDHQLESELGSATQDPGGNRISEPRSPQDESGEPELPPTPAELGLEKAPERPKGLWSSSPSGRLEKRRRRPAGEGLISSPLKKANAGPVGQGHESSTARLKLDRHEVQGEFSKKQTLKKQLSAQLQQLKDEVAQLEKWAQRSELPDDYPEPDNDEVSKFISLLMTQNLSCAPAPLHPLNALPLSSLLSSLLPFSAKGLPTRTSRTSPPPTNPFALRELAEPKPYLTVFAPLTLTAHSTKISASDSDILTEIHDLTLSAPSPFPRHVYKIPITFKTNPDTQSITSISTPIDSTKLPSQIDRWIRSRLANPLLKLDISGLCWGLNRYWEATVCRAQLWARMQRKYPALVVGLRSIPNDNESSADGSGPEAPKSLTKRDLRLLVPHLERTTMLFSSGGKKEPKLLLSCTLTLDEWTSEPQLQPEISVSSSPGGGLGTRRPKTEREAKNLFRGLLKDGGGAKGKDAGAIVDGDAIMRATEGVMGILFRD